MLKTVKKFYIIEGSLKKIVEINRVSRLSLLA